MASSAKIAANRANAAKSTGPTSLDGKQRSSNNARRHGLSLPIIADAHWSAEIQALAEMIAGANATEINLELARQVAAAQLDILRVRSARQHLITETFTNPDLAPAHQIRLREEIGRHASKLPAASVNRLLAALSKNLTRAFNQAMVIAQLGPKLAKLDRYERRALSRRKRAIRRYDDTVYSQLRGSE